ncbi:hypothetical protein M8J75_008690 [Diaphorina citri]|nr:hypothetical protein M8J75_008690 [Diaphorina citri]
MQSNADSTKSGGWSLMEYHQATSESSEWNQLPDEFVKPQITNQLKNLLNQLMRQKIQYGQIVKYRGKEIQ